MRIGKQNGRLKCLPVEGSMCLYTYTKEQMVHHNYIPHYTCSGSGSREIRNRAIYDFRTMMHEMEWERQSELMRMLNDKSESNYTECVYPLALIPLHRNTCIRTCTCMYMLLCVYIYIYMYYRLQVVAWIQIIIPSLQYSCIA